MAKRVYVAIGSTAIRCMRKLIERCIEENLYQTPEHEAVFIGVDSNRKELESLLQVDSDRRHIRAVQLALTSTDDTCRVVRAFRADWTGLGIGEHGVGGDRRLSFAALNWTRDERLGHELSELKGDDELILIGSAFGGTATGVFWNAAYWLRSRLKASRDQRARDDAGAQQDGQEGTPGFYAFLVLPSLSGDSSGYRVVGNFCDFLRDMQCADMCIRLQAQRNLPLRSVVFASVERPELVPLWTYEKHSHSEDGWLPFDRIFAVPTPAGGTGQGQVLAIVAEQMFILGPLGMWRGLDVTGQVVNLPGSPRGIPGPDSLVFGGVRMVAAKSGKHALLRRRFHDLLLARYRGFLSRNSSESGEGRTWARQVLAGIAEGTPQEQAQTRESIAAERPGLTNLFAGDLPVLAQELDSKLRAYRRFLSNHRYTWVGFPEFLDRSVRHPGSAPKSLCLEDLTAAYNDHLAYLRSYAEQADAYQQSMANYAARGRDLAARRQASFVARLTGYDAAANLEIRERLSTALKSLLEEYTIACRAEASLATLTDPVDLGQERRRELYADIEKFLAQQTQGSSGEALHECMYEERQNVDLTRLELDPSHLAEQVVRLLASRDGAGRQGIVESAEAEASRHLLAGANALQANNPLRALTISIQPSRLKPFPRFQSVDTCAMYANLFYVQHGAANSLTWAELTGAEGLGLTAFAALDPNHQVTASFDRNAPQQTYYWKGQQGGAEAQATGDVHGVWIGTMKLDCEAGELIRKTYAGVDLQTMQANVLHDGMQLGEGLRRLQTLPEAIAFGVLVGAIEEQLRGADTRVGGTLLNSKQVQVRIERPGGGGNPILLQAERALLNGCLTRSRAEAPLGLTHIPLAWVEALMAWVRGTFWDDMGMVGPGSLRTVLQSEDLILTQIRLQVPPAVVEGVRALAAKTDPLVHVEVA
jgi:hypothetical protein